MHREVGRYHPTFRCYAIFSSILTMFLPIYNVPNRYSFQSAQAHCTTFAMECARAQAAAKKLAEDEEGGEWSQQGDLVRLSQRTARVERNQNRLERSKLALDACKAVS